MKKSELITSIEALAEFMVENVDVEPIAEEVIEEPVVVEPVSGITLDVTEDVVPETISDALEEAETEDNVIVKADKEIAPEATREARRKNKKRLIEYKGETKTLTAWAKHFGVRHQTFYNRIVLKGMDPAEAFEMPLKKGKKEVKTV